uniref:NADH dehydrogenase subunit 4 n=1 Tax=Camallanus lacustris TaxID=378086 RepID=UPI0022FD4188|nr:NADH dehydrogenase subunit 4 [Camallanus lacustris]WAX01724.1 NADH dehydrogenase subunit 4 [Camallanus lacustris]
MLFLLLWVFFFDNYFFIFLFFVYIFFMMVDFSWFGVFLFCDSYVYLCVAMMSIFVLGLVLFVERGDFMLLLSKFLVFFCVIFFFSSSLLMMYFFYELTVFPILVMLLGFGSQVEKVSAGYYLVFYTVSCSSPFLVLYYYSFLFLNYVYFDCLFSFEFVFFLSLCFLVKFPVYFLHLWLPKAHVEAPTVASILLAGVMLKLGCVGFFRVLCGLVGFSSFFFLLLSFLGAVLCSFFCIYQSDVKSLAAYSSIVHMSMFLAGLMSFSVLGKSGGSMLLVSHGYSSALMFYLIGEFYFIFHTRMVYYFNSFMVSGVFFAVVLFLVFISNSGVPPSLCFYSEFLCVSSLFSSYFVVFVFVFFYCFFVFYYCFYVITPVMMGQSVLGFYVFSFNFCVPMLFSCYNVFWLGVFF